MSRFRFAVVELQHVDASVAPPTGVQHLRLLGAGAYGNLYAGRYLDVDDLGLERCRPAFVKVLIDPPGPEVDRLLQIGHGNLVQLRAVVVGAGPPSCLVYEGVEDAVDLYQYLVLRRMRDHEEGREPAAADWRHPVAVEVARALDYLASVGLVHRDVAARNVVVGGARGGPPSTKLSDFGLSRYPYADDYFRFPADSATGVDVPLRWLAPEALFRGRYSEASDAWSYGVMMWEMYCGQALTRPYEGYSDEQLVDAMAGTTGRHPSLPCIRGCPAATYSLMTECWKDLPVRRPRFRTILDRLGCDNPPSLDASPAAGSDSTGVTVVASMSGSPSVGRATSFRSPAAAHNFWKTGASVTFSPPRGRSQPRQTASPLVPRSNSVTSADSANVSVLM